MSLFTSLSVSASGMAAQRTRAEILVQNLANAETTRTAEGGPYRRKDVLFETQAVGSAFASQFDAHLYGSQQGVAISGIETDQSDPERRYMPGHPDADSSGYVAFPRVNIAEDTVDLISASRSYQANIAAISAVKDMLQHSLELFR